MKQSEISDEIIQSVQTLLAASDYKFKKTHRSLMWVPKNSRQYCFVVTHRHLHPLSEGTGSAINIGFVPKAYVDNEPFLEERFFRVSRAIKARMLDYYLENYLASAQKAGLKFSVSRYRRWVLLTQRDRTDITFENLDQLREVLKEVIPESINKYLGLRKNAAPVKGLSYQNFSVDPVETLPDGSWYTSAGFEISEIKKWLLVFPRRVTYKLDDAIFLITSKGMVTNPVLDEIGPWLFDKRLELDNFSPEAVENFVRHHMDEAAKLGTIEEVFDYLQKYFVIDDNGH